MLKVMAYIIANKVNSITTRVEFCESIGASSTNLSNISKGTQTFQKEHLRMCCLKYGISADYLFGLAKDMHCNNAVRVKTPPIERIREALNEIEEATKGL